MAADDDAKRLDTALKDLKDIVFEELSIEYPDLVLQKRLLPSQIPGGIGGCEPDGGAWFYQDKLIAVFEAKKQQDSGNAIERWFKNNYICRLINPQVSYVTFATGEGAYEGGA